MKRHIALGIAISFGSLLGHQALAQTSTNATTNIVLKWTAPTTNTDGTSITTSNTLTYNLYQGVCGSGSLKAVQTGLTATSTVVTSTSAGLCFAVTAVEQEGPSSVESALSSTATVIQPSFPGNLTFTVTITIGPASTSSATTSK